MSTSVLAGTDAARATPAPGTITTVAGSQPSGAATAIGQAPIALAQRGTTVYVADQWGNVVRALDLLTGSETAVFGSGNQPVFSAADPVAGRPAVDVTLGFPSGVAVDPTGRLLVSDTVYGRVLRVGPGGLVTVVAGTGVPGSAGDGGPATAAQLDQPGPLAFDQAGSLFIAEINGGRVRRVDAAGVITTVAGDGVGTVLAPGPVGDGGPSTAVSIHPVGIAVDATGRLLVADQFHDRIRRVEAGIISTVAGGGAGGLTDGAQATAVHLTTVTAVAVDAAGLVWFGEGSRVVRIDGTGGIHRVAGRMDDAVVLGDGGPATEATLSVGALLVEPSGELLVGDYQGARGNRVRRVDASGTITTIAGNGTQGYSGDGGPATQAQLRGPGGVAVDAAHNLFVADTGNNRVRKVTPAGVITTVAGNGAEYGDLGDGGPATAATVGRPVDVAVDAAGSLYVSDASRNRVRKVDSGGTISTLAGGGTASPGDGGPATAAELKYPAGLALAADGSVLVVDGLDSRVRRIDAVGVITTVAGTGVAGTGGDGGPAKTATLYYPIDVAVDVAGNVYIVDVLAGSVRKVDVAGTMSTVAVGLDFPGGVAVDGVGNLFLGDLTRQVRKLSLAGVVTVVAGTGVDGSSGDGGPATAARLGFPTRMAFDGPDLLVADIGASRVRRITETAGSRLAAPAVAPSALQGWGLNHVGQAGFGPAGARPIPGDVPVPPTVTRIGAGYYHSLDVGPGGSVSTWGWNAFGQLGLGTTADAPYPTPVTGLDGVVSVAGGAYHSLALKGDGTVWAWGWNGYGQLGDGTATTRTRPVQVAGLSGVVAIAAGAHHSLALKGDGTVWAWGMDAFGQLGDDVGTVNRSLPVPVAGLQGVTSLAGGGFHSLATTADGTLWAWGYNAYGQLGLGTTADAHRPRRVLSLGWATGVAAGAYHSVVLRADGTVWTFGLGGFGSLARAQGYADSSVPLQVPFMGDVRSVASGAFHSMAITGDNRLWTWGWDAFGQRGAGQPVQTPGAGYLQVGARAVAGGMGHTISLNAPITATSTGESAPPVPARTGPASALLPSALAVVAPPGR